MNSIVNTGSVPLRKRRPAGRRKRTADDLNFARNDTISMNSDNMLTLPNSDDLYYVMIQCAQDYAQFYQIK